jgi:carbon-monoxide dehydrogenase medium subunit
VRPVAFELEVPDTLEEALSLVGQHGDEATVLAGGQTLIPLLNMRIVRPDRVIDLSAVRALEGISSDDDEVVVGAMTRQAALQTSDVVARDLPLLRHVAGFVGQVQTRSRGTVGGSVALGSAVGELCVTLVALGGRVKVERTGSSRLVGAEAFFEDYLTTAIESTELVTEVRFPRVEPSVRWGFSELKLRGCDFPIVVVAAVVRLDGGMTCAEARVGVGGIAPTPVRIAAVESSLVGGRLDDEAIRRAAALIPDHVDPAGDLHAPAEYRTRVAVAEVERALRMAAA